MILVTLGTQDKSFSRLLTEIEKLKKDGVITDKVVVQAGFTKFDSEYLEVFDLIDSDKFNELLKKADLVITHGGIGTILTALKMNKKVIVAPRLAKYKEHVNDHQLEITDSLYEEGYILKCLDMNDLADVIKQSKSFKPKKYKSNQENFIKQLKKELDILLKDL